ncbi:MAG: hypothetical protein ACYSVY_00005, partial [Planctomycetota bacterium]
MNDFKVRFVDPTEYGAETEPRRVRIDGFPYWVYPTGLALLAIMGGGPAVSVQQAFRFRNDDGSESTATWMGDAGADQSIEAGTANRFRIRFLIEETNGGNINLDGTLQYSYNSGAYTAVSTSSSVIRSIGSLNTSWTITDNDTLVQRLGSGTYDTGFYDDDGAVETTIALDAEETEYEFCLYIVDADVSSGDTIDLRVYDSVTALDSYTDTPRITVLKNLTVSVSDTVSV